jgi:hypothetical protein
MYRSQEERNIIDMWLYVIEKNCFGRKDIRVCAFFPAKERNVFFVLKEKSEKKKMKEKVSKQGVSKSKGTITYELSYSLVNMKMFDLNI